MSETGTKVPCEEREADKSHQTWGSWFPTIQGCGNLATATFVLMCLLSLLAVPTKPVPNGSADATDRTSNLADTVRLTSADLRAGKADCWKLYAEKPTGNSLLLHLFMLAVTPALSSVTGCNSTSTQQRQSRRYALKQGYSTNF